MRFNTLFSLTCGFGLLAASSAFALPKASELVSDMGFGMNIGNTMEAPADPTSWGNVYPTKAIIDSMKAAGFNTIRIPCAWVTHADTTTNTINTSWMDSVQNVVDYVINDGMYAILNIHWDSGWLEDRVFDGTGYGKSDTAITNDASVIAKRQSDFWNQIGARFKDYDQHLLFASANEPGVNDPWLASGQYAFDETRMAVLKQYHEAFINTVRAQGGNNLTRTLIVQAPRTDEAYAFSLLANNMPTDPTGDGYMMAEIHFYPYQWSLMTKDDSWGNVFRYWGEGNYSTHDVTHNATYVKKDGSTAEQYAGEAYTDSIFAKLGDTFTSKGIPVVIGEYAAIKRIDDFSAKAGAEANCDDLKLHLQSRVYWYSKVTALSKKYGIVPVHWDVGGEENGSNTIIRRQNGKTGIWDYGVLNAMRRSYGLDTLVGESYTRYYNSCADVSDKMLQVTYTTTRTDSSVTGTTRKDIGGKDWSDYIGISFQAKFDLTSSALDGQTYGWTSADFFAMTSDKWEWTQYHLTLPSTSDTATYTIMFADMRGYNNNTQDSLYFTNSYVGAIGINVYGTVLNGTMLLDNVYLIKKDGSTVLFDDLNKATPTLEGIATGELVPTIFATSTTAIKAKPATISASKMFVNVQQGFVNATFTATEASSASAKLVNSMGQVVASQNFTARKGSNTVQLKSNYRGPALLVVKQGSQMQSQKVILK